MKEESCEQQGLYRSELEHDACGVGFVADIGGKSDHSIVTDGLTILKRLMHRGATGNDSETGDGAGILVRIPDAFFRKHIASLPQLGEYGVAMIFGCKGAEEKIENIVKAEGLSVIAWRDVPVDPTKIGHDARSVMPVIRQLFVKCADDRKLMVVRRLIEKEVEGAYLCSFSTKTIVYKGLLLATQMEAFYPDLGDADFTSSFAIVHQRYSTNTFPSWPLAHPFRALAHNGEINALKGNLNALSARESTLKSAAFGEDLKKLFPLVKPGQSDSASLDNMFELLVAAGRDAPHAMLMLLPQAWGQKYHMGHDVRGFYEYHSALMEPWDGPAAVAFTDGISLGATLDRNGLRPARWTLSKSGRFVLASEAGVLDIPAEEVERRGRLKPGSILWLDLEKHRLLEDNELKTFYARKSPYRRWVEENRISIQGLFTEITPSKVGSNLEAEQKFFGYTLEDLNLIMKPMAETGHEAVGAMGNDAALAMLSKKPRLLFDYFKQLFAQVTNPPIDPIREELVMSLMTYIGNLGNILEETQEHARLIKLRRPIVTDDELRRLVNAGVHGFESIKLPMTFAGNHSGADLRAALRRLAEAAETAAREGKKIIILSDHPSVRKEGDLPIPSLLATAAVNRALVKTGLRPSVGVIIESGEVREVMHYALLLGFGATAINPYLALETVSSLFPEDMVKAASNYVTAIDKGLLKIMSKMGISTLRSYRSAQIFEAVGLSKDVAREFFGGVTSPVGGIGLDEIAEAARLRAEGATPWQQSAALPVGGEYRLRKNGEDHLWTSEALTNFRLAVRSGDYNLFKKYTAEINDPSRHQVTLRSRFRFKPTFPIPLSEVEPVESIVKRFMGGAMSLGSLSPEAHETIAIALNELGTMSNSGEGGENSERFGTNKNCGIKQVASGRFGVTIEYLRNAKDLQIKLAQGAKPGEGGQLPAHKVNEFVAKLRHAKPGTTLISPPPHHDIYSIEDLAQLIYDLQCANPKARVSVKLVSEAGVGTIAAGVAKAHADVVLISGFDGGTGAAPLTSMKHAGLPWELGLAEAQQTLIKNGLRGRVKLQVDGQLRTGRDIVIGAMLGADEFGFGTTMLVSLGCVQCRNCNLNTCPVGIATQRPELRALFEGKKEHLQNYFRFLAEETREVLASLGLRSIEEAIGRADLLTGDEKDDFSAIFYRENGTEVSFNPYRVKEELENYDRKHFAQLLAKPEPAELELEVKNVNRTVGTELSGAIAEKYGAKGLPDESIKVHFHGTGGQSFGAFLAHGVTFTLEGAANDYVGKGLSGGVIVIKPEKTFTSAPEDSVIAGNVIAYGATSGKIFINGQAGERFAIRNSGVTLVAEGIGDHGCEYMTGGKVVVLGSVGVNFAAGMTGGVAYVYDERGVLDLYSNLGSIDLSPVEEGSEAEAELLGILAEHIERTSSPKAKRIVGNWTKARPNFVKVVPVKE